MGKSPSRKCALNLISGQLGAGKTTFLRQLLTQKPPQEHWVILVNEFGAVGIDGAILSEQSHTQIQQIPGGCICCTSKDELTTTVLSILDIQTPDRILIEPTGLGEPQNLLDIFLAPVFENQLEIQTLFTLFDVSETDVQEIKRLSILQSLISMADVIILNKTDLAASEKVQSVQSYLETLYPPKTAIFTTQQAVIDNHHLEHSHFYSAQFTRQETPFKLVAAEAVPQPPLPDTGVLLTGCHTRQSHQNLNTQAIGWVFDHQVQFDWKTLQSLFGLLAKTPSVILRAKGVFRVGDTPRMLFQLVNQTVSRELIAYRKDSRVEILLKANHDFDLVEFEQHLAASITSHSAT
ncbi:hypothetical protein CYQ88_02175 [Hydrogenovibrio sp. SC-1]|uniref:CobW family GTP-binding protein n=1 Tax=Hydrogenovibrio sp. SC-1 TaxID=2065820 RepID=UPI000C79C16B|nr:GTP-binding protein [Hydrogenovibrio sp. SC-1]PLA75058.1 hypothetical protein CYQ88_02175 [Hydrogenovibrio sp. SC-1]